MSSWPDERRVGSYALKGHRADAYLGSSWRARRGPDGPWVRVRLIDAAWIREDAVRAALCEAAFWEMELAHPNVAQVIDLVVQDGLGLVSEFIPGRDLHALLEITRHANLAIPQGVLLRIVDDLLAGLIALEDAARDVPELGDLAGGLHPECIHVGLDGRARLTDVTTSAILSRGVEIDSAPLRADYRAPEHWSGFGADACSDVFVLGALLWEALARRRLAAQGMLASAERTPPLPLPLNQQLPFRGEPIPSALVEIVTTTLQPDREQRYGGYRALRDAFADARLLPASRGEVIEFLKSLPGAGALGERAGEGPRASSDSPFAERPTSETPKLLEHDDVLELTAREEQNTEVVTLVHVVDDSHPALPAVVITNQPPLYLRAPQRRVRAALLVASMLAVAVALVLLSRGSQSDAGHQDGTAIKLEPIAQPPTPLGARAVTARAAGSAAGHDPNASRADQLGADPHAPAHGAAVAVDLSVAPDAGTAAAEPHRSTGKHRPANAGKPAKLRPFTPNDI